MEQATPKKSAVENSMAQIGEEGESLGFSRRENMCHRLPIVKKSD
jgi:hypothetical protein